MIEDVERIKILDEKEGVIACVKCVFLCGEMESRCDPFFLEEGGEQASNPTEPNKSRRMQQ